MTFGVTWWTWFRSLALPTLVAANGRIVRDAAGDWSTFKCPGRNGLINLVIGLSWWGNALVEQPKLPASVSRSFANTVDDVTWIIRTVVEQTDVSEEGDEAAGEGLGEADDDEEQRHGEEGEAGEDAQEDNQEEELAESTQQPRRKRARRSSHGIRKHVCR